MPLNVRPLPAVLAKKAKEELFEDPSRNEKDVQILREWAEKQPHLNARLDDQFLLTFVRTSKHDLEKAQKKLDLFYTVRTALPELYKNRRTDDSKLWEIMNLGFYLSPSRPLSEDGPKLVIIRPGLIDPNIYNIFDLLRPGKIFQDINIMEDDHAVIAGVAQIVDGCGMTMAHLLQMDVSFGRKKILFSGTGTVLRQSGLHFINMSPIFEKVFNLVKSFLSEKQKSRIFVHSNMESLYEHIPQKMLPKEYGGENGSLEETIDRSKHLFAKYRDFFVEEDRFGTDEAFRALDSKFNAENLFGEEGTFKRLEVD